ncbi:hypothetical protein [Loktanella sp. S4079]|uniref:hypothetical protein n=1 Tax=Loktanella sp. S4079 TaxID=579483 RepID=UPI000698072C|nr:hypothetical protein [Loktanella sp. S4079]
MGVQSWKPIDYAAINIACMLHFPGLVEHWLPDGHRQGGEWVALNPTRADRHKGSFRINLESGLWSDFATGDRGGEPRKSALTLNRSEFALAANDRSPPFKSLLFTEHVDATFVAPL